MLRQVGPLEKELRHLWQIARRRIYLPQNWWVYFQLTRKYELTFLRLEQVKVATSHIKAPDCENCVNICCTGPYAKVTLRLRDIAALIDAGLSEHIQQDKNKEIKSFKDKFPLLKRDSTGTCLLLTKHLTCGAYPHWPMSCARYPYALDVKNKRIFYAKRCESFEFINGAEATGKARYLAQAAVESYNEDIKDIILLHFAQQELEVLGLLSYLS